MKKATATIIGAIAIITILASVLFLWQILAGSNSAAYVQVPEAAYTPTDNEPAAPTLEPQEDNTDYTANESPQNEPLECEILAQCFEPIFHSEPLPEHIIEFITGRTFRDYAPFGVDFLAYLTITHVDFNGNDRIGHMIVAAEIADEVLDIFREIYESHFPIYSIRLIDYFDAIDYYSLEANNSSVFNFRYIANTNVISRHGFGMAIDINPIQNPYVRGDNVLPEAGRAYLDRTDIRPGMIISGDAVYTAFTSRGWTWGGNWTLPRDYHHFERR